MPQDAPAPDASSEVALAVRALMPALKRQATVAVGIITVAIVAAAVAAGTVVGRADAGVTRHVLAAGSRRAVFAHQLQPL